MFLLFCSNSNRRAGSYFTSHDGILGAVFMLKIQDVELESYTYCKITLEM